MSDYEHRRQRAKEVLKASGYSDGGLAEVPAHVRDMKSAGEKSPSRLDKKSRGGKNWIAGATKNKGALHKALHVPEGTKIPAKKLTKAAHSENPKIRKEAVLAKTLKKFH